MGIDVQESIQDKPDKTFFELRFEDSNIKRADN